MLRVKNLKALIELTRLEHGLMYGVGVLVGAVLAGWGLQFSWPLAMGVMVAISLEAGAFALNDYFDVKADRANRRTDRPIIRGDVSSEAALFIAAVGLVVSNVIAFFVSLDIFVLVLLFSLLSILYNSKMKKYAIVGNLFIGATMALPFLFGGLIFRNITEPIAILSGMALIIGLGREVMKDIEDVKGDRLVGARTLPVIIGTKKAIYSAIACYIIGIGLSVVPFFSFFSAKPIYLLILVTDAMFLWVAAQISKSQGTSVLGSARRTTLIAMIVALIAFLASSL